MKRETVYPGDEHFKRHAIGAYGFDSWSCAMTYLKRRRTFVDVGAHIGHFTYNALDRFKDIVAFEPRPLNFQCLERNVNARVAKLRKKPRSVRLFLAAVGDVQMHKPRAWFSDPSAGKNSGAWEISLEDNGGEELATDFLTIDSLQLKDCDLIKIDTQGWESRVLKGAAKTIEACKPVLIVELVNDSNINELLIKEVQAMGYNILAIVQKNGIFKAK